jgi:hypothetical protein
LYLNPASGPRRISTLLLKVLVRSITIPARNQVPVEQLSSNQEQKKFSERSSASISERVKTIAARTSRDSRRISAMLAA